MSDPSKGRNKFRPGPFRSGDVVIYIGGAEFSSPAVHFTENKKYTVNYGSGSEVAAGEIIIDDRGREIFVNHALVYPLFKIVKIAGEHYDKKALAMDVFGFKTEEELMEFLK